VSAKTAMTISRPDASLLHRGMVITNGKERLKILAIYSSTLIVRPTFGTWIKRKINGLARHLPFLR
jgi:hypothetical protein